MLFYGHTVLSLEKEVSSTQRGVVYGVWNIYVSAQRIIVFDLD